MTDTKQDILRGIESGSIADELPKPLSDAEVDALVESAKSDPGAPFESDSIARAAATKHADLPTFMRLRARLKDAKIGIVEFDKAIDSALDKDQADGDADEGLQGRAITFPRIDPWPEPVQGATLLDGIEMQIRRYLILSPEATAAVALWIVHAHCFRAFTISPRLGIVSPEKRCGKTRFLRVVQTLVPRPLSADNITPAAMFRTIEKCQPTLLIDEADTFLRDNEELRGVINSGHERDGQVIRLTGEDFQPSAFSTFCPTAIAAIGNLPGTIEDRAIKIAMRRRLSTETVVSFRRDRAHDLHELRRKAARWVADHEQALRDADPSMPPGLHDRACDNWRPLTAIADAGGCGWPDRARWAAEALSNQDAEQNEQSQGVMLLGDIRLVWTKREARGGDDTDRISSTELAGALAGLPDRPWLAWSRGNPITPNAVARRLKPFGIIPNTIKLSDGKQPNGYKRNHFDEAFARYLPPSPGSPVQSSPSSPTPENPATTGQTEGSPGLADGEVAKPVQSLEEQGRGEDGELSEPHIGALDEDGDEDELPADFFEQFMR